MQIIGCYFANNFAINFNSHSSVKIAFNYCKVNVQSEPRKSLEALARNARYSALDSISLLQIPSFCLGKHADDQAENCFYCN